MSKKVFSFVALVAVLVMATVLPGTAASTTKNLSTNFTLVNLGTGAATGVIDYIKPDGGQWKAQENFSIGQAGGQAVFRQYLDPNLPAGQGSVVVSADAAMGAVVQIQARGQVPTSGAYAGVAQGSDTFYVPLVARHRGTVSGVANSQIIVQNTGTGPVSATVALINSTGGNAGSKALNNIAAGASAVYDLEEDAALGEGFIGSAKVTASTGGQIAVVSNFFTGANILQTFNGFPKENVGSSWVAPLFTSRLGNGLSAPITIQNVGGALNANTVTLTCAPDPSSTNQTAISLKNTTSIGTNQSYAWNPVTDLTNFPSLWTGACRVDGPAGAQLVAFVQLRFIGQERADSYQALNAASTDRTVVVPLVAKRLPNTFATAVTIANLRNGAGQDAHVHLSYKPSSESGSQATLETDAVIPAGKSLIQNQRIVQTTAPGVNLPENWQGTLTVTSTDQPINAFVQLDFLGQSGDPYMTHNVFTKP